MKTIKYVYVLLLPVFLLLSCNFPNEYKIYHWADYWISSMDFNGQDTSYIHPAISENYNYYSEVAIPFLLDGQLKILVYANSMFYVFDEHGENPVFLVGNLYTGVNDFSISKNGEYVVYSNGRFLFKAKTDGNGVVQLTGDSSYIDYQPDFSPDGNEIVFLRRKPKNKWRAVALLDRDGETVHILTDNTDDMSDVSSFYYPKFYPDGQTIYYIYSSENFVSGLYSIDRNGENKQIIYGYADALYIPVRFSLNGLIAFAHGRHLLVANKDGTKAKDLGELCTGDHCPDYQISDDGQWIVFTTNNYNGEVRLIRTDGSEMRTLQEGTHPYFIPTQNRILFYGKRWHQSKNPPKEIRVGY